MPKEDTQFKKGNSGKPKGAKNRTTEEIRQFIQQVMDKNLETLEEDLDRMSPSNKWQIIEKLTKYFLPALTKNDNHNENSGEMSIKVTYEDNKDVSDSPDEGPEQ